jgi:hypothetical protein
MDKKQAAKIVGYILDAEYGDVTDINNGFDLKLIVKETDRVWQGKKVKEATIEAARKESPLSADKSKVEKWLKSLPNVDDYYKPKTTDEIKAQFEEWLASGGPQALVSGASGGETSRGAPAGESELDKLAKETSEAAEKPATEKKKSAKKSIDEELEDIVAGVDGELG